MKRLLLVLVAALATTIGCAGFPVPFTGYRAMDWRVESSLHKRNSTCTDLQQLNSVSSSLEERHVKFIQTRDTSDAILIDELLASLGSECKERFTKLSTPQIKTELFGDVQTIKDSDKLRELGGVSFDYENVSTETGIELTLHLRGRSTGFRRRMVAVYRLEDKRVIHFNSSGTNNVDSETRRWPLDQFFGVLVGVAAATLIP